MKNNTKGLSIQGIDSQIAKIKFTNINMKLALPIEQDGKGWDNQKIQLAETEYRRFLTLILRYPHEKFVPNKLMDEFWHMHILDTAAYRKDCAEVFGLIIDHYPYYGLNGQVDKQNLDKDFLKTKALYHLNFGIKMDRSALASRCGDDHACHAESSCACRVSTACRN